VSDTSERHPSILSVDEVKNMKKGLIWVERSLIPNVATGFFLISCATMFVEAMSRRAFSHSFVESEEIICYTLVWAIFLSLAESGRSGCHIRISLLVSKSSPVVRKVINCFNALAGFIYSTILTVSSVGVVLHLKGAGIVSYSPMRFPLWILFLVLIFGGILLAIYYIEKMVLVLTNEEDTLAY